MELFFGKHVLEIHYNKIIDVGIEFKLRRLSKEELIRSGYYNTINFCPSKYMEVMDAVNGGVKNSNRKKKKKKAKSETVY